jgi:ZIP family zinc transporter
MEGNLSLAFGLTALAGLSTGLGALVVFFSRRPKLTLLSFGLGFSSGVMVYISLVEILPLAITAFGAHGGPHHRFIALACFFGGIGLSALIDKLVPEPANPHEAVPEADMAAAGARENRPALKRLGLMSAVAIGIHNFPEGMATFAATMSDPSLGVSIAVAVAIHNIPEGIAVAVPIWFATRSRGKALFHSFLSGLAEPVGALIAFLVLLPFIESNPLLVDGLLSAVAGIMVFISFDELLPTAREYGKGHTVILGVVLGMAVMSVSLLLV